MPSPFAVIARRALQPAYAHHAQEFDWLPLREADDVNAPATPDASRPGGRVLGCFYDKDAPSYHRNAWDARADQRPGSSTNVTRIEFPPPIDGAPPNVQRLDVLTDENQVSWCVANTRILKTGVLVCLVNLTSKPL